MKKNAIAWALSIACLGTVLFTSCEKESVEGDLLDKSIVGESIVRVNYNDTLMLVKGVVGKINEKGKFSFRVELLNDEFLIVNTASLEEGTFPTHTNISQFYYPTINRFGASVDTMSILKPKEGFVKLASINKIGQALNGEFKMTIYPPTMIDTVMYPFEISGNFENLRYDRVQEQFFMGVIGDLPFKPSAMSAELVDSQIIVKASNALTMESIEIAFHKEIENGLHQLPAFSATYKSKNGVVYKTDQQTSQSELRIRKNEENTISGDFLLNLKNNNGATIQISSGEFRLKY